MLLMEIAMYSAIQQLLGVILTLMRHVPGDGQWTMATLSFLSRISYSESWDLVTYPATFQGANIHNCSKETISHTTGRKVTGSLLCMFLLCMKLPQLLGIVLIPGVIQPLLPNSSLAVWISDQAPVVSCDFSWGDVNGQLITQTG